VIKQPLEETVGHCVFWSVGSVLYGTNATFQCCVCNVCEIQQACESFNLHGFHTRIWFGLDGIVYENGET
jgi:hypothetical protein